MAAFTGLNPLLSLNLLLTLDLEQGTPPFYPYLGLRPLTLSWVLGPDTF